MQTRYYDPEVGRFLNADDVCYIDPESVNGLNLYAYCANNPVMGIDPNGNAVDWGKIGKGFLGFLLSFCSLGAIPMLILTLTGNMSPEMAIGFQIGISAQEIVAGILLISAGIGGSAGMGLIAMGTGSLINGFMNEASGGTFFAGWIGGQISGLASMIPYVGAPIGAFFSSVITDGFNSNWKSINFGKAFASAIVAWFFDIPMISITEIIGKEPVTKLLQYIFSYRGVLISLINGFFNWLYGRK